MFRNPKDIKEIRKKLGLTQSQLANRSNVSQSLIAKVEAGILDPTYSNAIKIFNALEEVSKKVEVKALDLMTPKIVSVSPESNIKDAIKKMKAHSFSQLPVIHQNKAVGIVSESLILNSLLDNSGKSLEDIMESPPPVVAQSTQLSAISNLLKYFQIILVSKKGKLVGVITKTDVLASMYKAKDF